MNLINYDYHLQFYNMKRSGLNETYRFQKLRGQELFYPQETWNLDYFYIFLRLPLSWYDFERNDLEPRVFFRGEIHTNENKFDPPPHAIKKKKLDFELILNLFTAQCDNMRSNYLRGCKFKWKFSNNIHQYKDLSLETFITVYQFQPISYTYM